MWLCGAAREGVGNYTSLSAVDLLTTNWTGMGLDVDLVDYKVCEQTRGKCNHKTKWYHDNSYAVPPETLTRRVEILKTIAVMRVLAGKPKGHTEEP